MKKFIGQAVHLNALRKLFGWQMLGEAVSGRLQREILSTPPNGKVLVLAPHPGDEIFGIGGTLARHREQGDEIRIIYLCDGRSGTKRPVTEIVRDELKKVRRAEAVAGITTLGINPGKLTFWAYRDGELTANKTVVKALTQVLVEYLPTIIYAPHAADSHPDHVTTAQLLAKTLVTMGGELPGEIWGYEFWQPTFANRIVDITSVSQQKAVAMQAHASQLKCRAYDTAIDGLNRYRGGLAGLQGPAEGFLALKPKMYLQLWSMLSDIS